MKYKNVKKATKEIVDRIGFIHDRMDFLTPDNHLDSKDKPEYNALFDEWHSLLRDYDLRNEVFEDESGHVGVKWCWGEVMIPARYDAIKHSISRAEDAKMTKAVVSRNGKDYLVNYLGEEVFEADDIKYDILSPSNWYFFRIGGKYGMIDDDCRLLLEAKYDSIESHNFLYVLTLGNKKGFFDVLSNWVVEPKFDSLDENASGLMVVSFEGVKGFINKDFEFTSDRMFGYYNLRENENPILWSLLENGETLMVYADFDDEAIDNLASVILTDESEDFYNVGYPASKEQIRDIIYREFIFGKSTSVVLGKYEIRREILNEVIGRNVTSNNDSDWTEFDAMSYNSDFAVKKGVKIFEAVGRKTVDNGKRQILAPIGYFAEKFTIPGHSDIEWLERVLS